MAVAFLNFSLSSLFQVVGKLLNFVRVLIGKRLVVFCSDGSVLICMFGGESQEVGDLVKGYSVEPHGIGNQATAKPAHIWMLIEIGCSP